MVSQSEKLGSFGVRAGLWLPLLIIMFIVWVFFVPYVFRWVKIAPEFEADISASQIMKDDQGLANSTARKYAIDHAHAPRDFSSLAIWRRFYHMSKYPTLNEQLRNLGFEIEKVDIKVRRIKAGS